MTLEEAQEILAGKSEHEANGGFPANRIGIATGFLECHRVMAKEHDDHVRIIKGLVGQIHLAQFGVDLSIGDDNSEIRKSNLTKASGHLAEALALVPEEFK